MIQWIGQAKYEWISELSGLNNLISKKTISTTSTIVTSQKEKKKKSMSI